jgi:cytoskeletal protein RodZ
MGLRQVFPVQTKSTFFMSDIARTVGASRDFVKLQWLDAGSMLASLRRCCILKDLVENFSDQIGDQLQTARETAGLSWEDVHFQTRIPCSVMKALEAGDFSVFSSPAYAKSFLSQYSEYLGVDASQWLEALVPASFISGEIVEPSWMKLEEGKKVGVKVVAAEPSGWLSALSVMAVTGGLIVAAFQGYLLLEAKFGDPPLAESPRKSDVLGTTTLDAVPTIDRDAAERTSVIDSSLATEPGIRLSAGEITEQVPRAIIVR